MTTVGSLCTGYGGLELAVEELLGPVEHAWHAEVDPDATAVLAATWPGVPNLGDITAVDFAGLPAVDLLLAGYPCQGESNAGLRKGADDPRFRWPDVARAVRDLRPRVVLLENVRGHLNRSFPRVVADLAALGYVGSWRCVRASDVGAPHRRERVFIVATAADSPGVGWAQRGTEPAGAPGRPGPAVSGNETAGAATSGLTLLPTPSARDGRRGAGWGDQPGRPLSETIHRLLPTPTVNDSRNGRNATAGRSEGAQFNTGWTLSDVAYAERWGEYGPAIARWEQVIGRPAPEPTEPGRLGKPRLSPQFVEWMMGLPQGHVTKHVERRSAALRILGNGVVWQQAAHAYAPMLSALTGAVAA